MAADFGLFHREDRCVKERLFLVKKLEKFRCTHFGHKAFHGCCILFIYVDHFSCYLGCNYTLM